MNTDELSTGGGSPSAKSKKREGEKRTSLLTPLREKGKGKEKGLLHRQGGVQDASVGVADQVARGRSPSREAAARGHEDVPVLRHYGRAIGAVA